MAIIKCPECGHQISDKAPVCPSCGVEISGKITRCTECGEVYFRSDVVCPHCHKPNSTGAMNRQSQNTTQETMVQVTKKEETTVPAPQTTTTGNNNNDKNKKKNSTVIIIVSVVFAIILVGICAYFYNNAQENKEQEEYEFALNSDDPTILNTYLSNFKESAPQEHIDSITAHLNMLIQQDQEWTNAAASNSKSALTEYIKNHPNSIHVQEAMSKIDSIDWAQCSTTNTVEAYQLYIDNHPDGNHFDEASMALESLKSTVVSEEEKQTLTNLFRLFFISINSKDEEGLTSTVDDLVYFLGKQNAIKSDIVSYMHKLYNRADVSKLVWSISKDMTIDKTVTPEGEQQYNVTFMANEKVEKSDNSSTTTNYRINAKVGSNGKITEMSMTRLVE